MTLTPIPRREFLTWSGIAGILAAGRAPAFAQGTTLHFLQWSHFVPAADTLFEAQAREFGKQAGVDVKIERINQNDLQARATAAIQSASGPDIMILANNHPQLYESAMVDVSDVAEEIGGKQGGWHDYAKVNCLANGRWIGVPQFIVSWAVTYREDWFKEAAWPGTTARTTARSCPRRSRSPATRRASTSRRARSFPTCTKAPTTATTRRGRPDGSTGCRAGTRA